MAVTARDTRILERKGRTPNREQRRMTLAHAAKMSGVEALREMSEAQNPRMNWFGNGPNGRSDGKVVDRAVDKKDEQPKPVIRCIGGIAKGVNMWLC